MASHPGVWAGQLSPMIKVQDAADGLVPFLIGIGTVAGTATYRLHATHAPFSYLITRVRGRMTAAGGAGDTVQVTDGAGVAITEVINLAALADNATFQAQTIDDATWLINNWSDDAIIVTGGGALCTVIIEGLRAESVLV